MYGCTETQAELAELRSFIKTIKETYDNPGTTTERGESKTETPVSGT